MGRNASLFPYINLEALTEDAGRLIGLLQSRLKHSAVDWCPYDNSLPKFPWECGSVDVYYNDNCVIMYGEKYGQLTGWKAAEAHKWNTVGFPRAVLILEAQAKVMKFLRRMVEKLSADLAKDEPQNWTADQGVRFKTLHSIEIGSAFLNQAYFTCPSFDIVKLSSIAKARVDLTEDHLWQLQTNPDYLRGYIGLMAIWKRSFKSFEWNPYSITAMDLMHDTWTTRYWDWIALEVEELQVLYSEGRTDSENATSPETTEYDKRLGDLETLVLQLINLQARYIKGVIPHRPGFSNMYKVEWVDGGISYTLKDSLQKTDLAAAGCEKFLEDPLQWVLAYLVMDPNAPRTYNHSKSFDFLEQRLADCPKDRVRVDESLYRMFSDLTAFHEILFMLRCRRPRASIRDIQVSFNFSTIFCDS